MYSLYSLTMKRNVNRSVKGVEEARKSLPAILEAAAQGKTTVITRHGHAIAAVVPVSAVKSLGTVSLLSLAGTGKRMWSGGTGLARLREEWNR
jgi:Antitoxin of toxin-antitoxin stability system